MTYTVCVICHNDMDESNKNTCSDDCQRLKNNKASKLKHWRNKVLNKPKPKINPKWLIRGPITTTSGQYNN